MDASKVWLLSIVDVNLSMNGKKKNVSMYKTGGCENRLCAWTTRARQGTCRIW